MFPLWPVLEMSFRLSGKTCGIELVKEMYSRVFSVWTLIFSKSMK